MAFDLAKVGGKRLFLNDGIDTQAAWNFGWIPPDQRTPEERLAHDTAMASMPEFKLLGSSNDEEKVFIWECWKHPLVIAATNGKVFPGFHQLTGSCVGNGGGNTVFSLEAVEVVRLGDQEEALVPFWPLPYGKSRELGGMNGQGEGSLGSTFAQAMREYGTVAAQEEGLPQYTDSDGISYTKAIEMKWSDGRAIPQEWLEKSRNHLVKTTAPCRSADDLRDALRNYYPCSFAGDWGGLMQCPVTGNPPVLLNRHSGSWGHQQSAHGWWNHPELGEIFYIMNQWGQDAHGRCPTGAPPGGYWIKKADADYQCRNGEVFAFSQFSGFPAQKIDWRH
jgi:hypothetical protein